ncbi:amidase domain-containing protein [Paenibacillus protaetiae]|uniref:Putative amidase domain-containing protein n=1 Tax=Paenibacillus protaetiae TaxID=2509456 RepID=A0A4P6F9C2_9BACL|nr:amidase domain-containing protein [Paenibacillus protaetiae]QAY67078.1 hypothetical protein ET464_12405 [Paenibacillus protaetiae]
MPSRTVRQKTGKSANKRGKLHGFAATAGSQPKSKHRSAPRIPVPADPLPSLARGTAPEAGQEQLPSVPGEWKEILQRYIGLYNQAENEQHAEGLHDFVRDSEHCLRLGQRLQRLRDRDLLRGALSLYSETTAELARVNESASEVSVLLKLHVRRQMDQSGRGYTEERTEYERLWLERNNGFWTVVRVEPVIAERRPRYGSAAEAWIADIQEDHRSHNRPPAGAATIPYLNYDLFPQFKHRAAAIPYRRDQVTAYADRYWNEGNEAFENFEVNCTNYVSQCVFAGNAPMNYTGKRENGWWYKGKAGGREWWSYSWAVSNALTQYLSIPRESGLRGEIVYSPEELQIGDIITYDWNGDNRFQHSAVVTAFDAQGMPLVNANTVASRHRYWDYRDSYAWTEQTRYRFFHLADLM